MWHISALNLLITHQVGGPVHHLHQLCAALHGVKDEELCIREIGQSCCSSTCLFSSRPLSIQISPMLWCPLMFPLLPLWFGTGLLLPPCSEKVVGTICHTRLDQPMTNSRAWSHILYSRLFEWVCPVAIWMSWRTNIFYRQQGA